MFIQLPVILALFFVFRDGINLSSPDIYSFITKPPFVNSKFLGLIDLSQGNIFLSFLVGLTQFFQAKLSLPSTSNRVEKSSQLDNKSSDSFGDSLAKSMNFQVKFVLPIFIMVISYQLNVAVSIYWIVNNVFTIVHELYVKKKAENLK